MILAIACMIAGLLGCLPVDGRIAWACLFIGGLLALLGISGYVGG